MLTERGIYLNLEESDYKYTIEGLTFYFSSKVYLEKFKNKVNEYISVETAKFYCRYRTPIVLDIYFMIAFYKKIEKRGFRIEEESSKKEISENVGFCEEIVRY